MKIVETPKNLIIKTKDKIIDRKNKKRNVLKLIDEMTDTARQEREKFDYGTKEYNQLTNEINELLKLRIEAEEMRARKIAKKLEIFLSASGIFVGFKLKTLFMNKGMEMEKENTYTSTTFRTIINWIMRKEN